MRTGARTLLAAGLLLAGAAAFAAVPAAAQDAADEVEDLPEGEGRETVFYACTACHGMRIVTQQGLTRERWDATIDAMVDRHGMYVPDPAERAEMLDYLSAHFPPRRDGYTNPFLRR